MLVHDVARDVLTSWMREPSSHPGCVGCATFDAMTSVGEASRMQACCRRAGHRHREKRRAAVAGGLFRPRSGAPRRHSPRRSPSPRSLAPAMDAHVDTAGSLTPSEARSGAAVAWGLFRPRCGALRWHSPPAQDVAHSPRVGLRSTLEYRPDTLALRRPRRMGTVPTPVSRSAPTLAPDRRVGHYPLVSRRCARRCRRDPLDPKSPKPAPPTCPRLLHRAHPAQAARRTCAMALPLHDGHSHTTAVRRH